MGASTLTRFYTFHFLFPFILAGFVLLHLLFLHLTGSSSRLSLNPSYEKVSFHAFFSLKDFLGFCFVFGGFFFLLFSFPLALGDPENFSPSNPIATPPHIQPEWYFLFAYAILRSIPSKLGGALALIFSILVLGFLFLTDFLFFSLKFSPFKKLIF